MIRRATLSVLAALAATPCQAQPLNSSEGLALYEQHARDGRDAVTSIEMALHCGVIAPLQANVAGYYFEADISHASFKYGHPVFREAIEAMFAKARAEGDRKATPAFCRALRADPQRTGRLKELIQGVMDQPAPDY